MNGSNNIPVPSIPSSKMSSLPLTCYILSQSSAMWASLITHCGWVVMSRLRRRVACGKRPPNQSQERGRRINNQNAEFAMPAWMTQVVLVQWQASAWWMDKSFNDG